MVKNHGGLQRLNYNEIGVTCLNKQLCKNGNSLVLNSIAVRSIQLNKNQINFIKTISKNIEMQENHSSSSSDNMEFVLDLRPYEVYEEVLTDAREVLPGFLEYEHDANVLRIIQEIESLSSENKSDPELTNSESVLKASTSGRKRKREKKISNQETSYLELSRNDVAGKASQSGSPMNFQEISMNANKNENENQFDEGIKAPINHINLKVNQGRGGYQQWLKKFRKKQFTSTFHLNPTIRVRQQTC